MNIITSVPAPEEIHQTVVRDLMEGRDVEENFRWLFQRYYKAVFHFLARKGLPAEDCRDLTQEVFVAVYSGIDGLRSEEAFATWLFSIARHVMLRHIERRGRTAAGDAEPAECAANEPDPLRRMLDQEKVERLREALLELPGRVQDCLRGRLVDGLNYRQIGEKLGISEGTVAVHVHRGLKNLRIRLREFFGQAPFEGGLE